MRKVIVLILLILSISVFAGTTGKIAGRVYDAQNAQGLPGVNVIVEGTGLGAATDADGYYVILDVPPGTYRLTATMIGYKPLTVEGVKILTDLTTTINFPLEPTVVEMKEGVTIKAERPIIQKDVTTSVAIVDAKQMKNMPVNNVQGVVAQQAGVISRGGIHIRGGRGTEVVYMVDGVELKDPYTGGYDTHIPQMSIQETSVYTGGFGAEYGSAQSGVVNVVTKEGGSHFSGNFSMRGNDFGGVNTIQNLLDLNYNKERSKRFDLSLGGPFTRKMRYFFGTEINKTLGRFPHSDSYLKNFNGKIAIKPGINQKLTLNGLLSRENFHTFRIRWKNVLDNMPDYFSSSYMWGAAFTHSFSAKAFYQVKINNYSTFLHYNVFEDGSFDINGDGFINPTDHDSVVAKIDPYTGDTTYTTYASDRNGIDDFTDVDNDRNVEIDTLGELGYDWPELPNYPFKRPDDENGFITDGYYRLAWHNDAKHVYTANFDINSQFTKTHLAKLGVEGKYFDMFNYTADMASGGNVYMEYTDANPYSIGAYISDKMEFEGMIVNASMRYDFFNPNTDKYPADIYHPVTNITTGGEILSPVKVPTKSNWSPRIGISYPVTDMDVFHFTYGHYFQIPPLYILYRNQNYDFSGAFPLVGNPDISPEKTVSYEVGVKHAFNDVLKVELTAFSKDITGLTDTEAIFYTAVNYYTRYRNADYGSARGFEVVFSKREGGVPNYLTWNINYTYQIARGKSSTTRQNYEFIWSGYIIPAEEHYLNWDQRHTITATIGISVPKGENLFGNSLFSNFGINFVTSYGSGYPWTPPSRSRVQHINEARLPYTLRTDVRIYKNTQFGNFGVGTFIDIYNLFNRKNLLTIADAEWYHVYGDPEGHYGDPTVWDLSRLVRIGVEINW